jgi:hypothetical protein
MGKRPIGRKVVIVFEGRDPSDPARLLRAVADELRPREVEIHVKLPPPGAAPLARPDEQLETQVRKHAAQVLDQKDREVQAAPKEAVSVPTDPAKDLVTKRQRLIAWIKRLVSGGWRITVDVVLPAAERAAKIYKDIHR